MVYVFGVMGLSSVNVSLIGQYFFLAMPIYKFMFTEKKV